MRGAEIKLILPIANYYDIYSFGTSIKVFLQAGNAYRSVLQTPSLNALDELVLGPLNYQIM